MVIRSRTTHIKTAVVFIWIGASACRIGDATNDVDHRDTCDSSSGFATWVNAGGAAPAAASGHSPPPWQGDGGPGSAAIRRSIRLEARNIGPRAGVGGG